MKGTKRSAIVDELEMLQPLPATNDSDAGADGKVLHDAAFCIEVFCGTAGLTACMRKLFPNSFGIDHVVKRPKSQVVCLDLQKPECQQLVTQWATSKECVWVHFRIPCQTSSRARDRRMSNKNYGPPPLRSEQFPTGRPPHVLSPNSLARVRAANRLYLFMEKLISSLHQTTVWTIENPLRSWLWKTVYFVRLQAKFRIYMWQFDMCRFGGKRLKRTCIATPCEHLGQFALRCTGGHDHMPYTFANGRFDTALEAAYPAKFCEILVQGVAEHLQKIHAWGSLNAAKRIKTHHSAAVVTGTQPRKVPQLVSEFADLRKISGISPSFSIPVDAKKNLTACLSFDQAASSVCLHSGSRLLRRTTRKRGLELSAPSVGAPNSTIDLDLLRAATTDSLNNEGVPDVRHVPDIVCECKKVIHVPIDSQLEWMKLFLACIGTQLPFFRRWLLQIILNTFTMVSLKLYIAPYLRMPL